MVANVCMSQLYPGSAAPYIPVDRRARFVVAPLLMKQITCSRLRLLPLLLTLFTVLAGPPSWAQPKQTAAPAISPDQARAALDTLNDPKKRAAFTATLEAILKAPPETRAAEAKPEPRPGETKQDPRPAAKSGPAAAPDEAAGTPREPLPLPLEPDSLGAQVLLTASSFLTHVTDAITSGIETAQSLPLLWGWIVVMSTNPLGQRLLTETAWRLAVAVALSGGVALAIRYLLRRPRARLMRGRREIEPHEHPKDPEESAEFGDIEPPPRPRLLSGASKRFGLGLLRLALDLIPVLALLVAGHVVAASHTLGGRLDSRLIILAVVQAMAFSLVLLSVFTFLFEPEPPGLRLLTIPSEAGSYLIRWTRRLVLIGVPGYTIGEIALLLGLSTPAHDALQKAVGLLLTICLAVIVVQTRRTVRRWLSTQHEPIGPLARLRNRLARYWYWAALFILISAWLSWTLGAPDAIARSLWYFAITAAVVAGAAMARVVMEAILNRLYLLGSESHAIRGRLSVYHPMVRRLTRLIVNVLAILVLLQLYGLGGLSWLLTTDVGRRVVSGLVTLGVTIGLAIFVWEGINLAIQSHLDQLRQQGQTVRLARVRTLLPLMRTALAILVAVVAGLMILSEIGVNIAPLLAGAGIVGVAIGLGAQKLVQDVITGVFLLLENTMQVGDVVRVGDQSGVVESLSVRTIRLRTDDGSVVVIPFSSVTTVVNMTRDFSRAVIVVNVAMSEDVDRVSGAMRDIVREMRSETAWSSIILDDFEVLGLEKMTDQGLQIKGRIKCTPFGRWSVGREFNQRLQSKIDSLGIALPNTATRLVLDRSIPVDFAGVGPQTGVSAGSARGS